MSIGPALPPGFKRQIPPPPEDTDDSPKVVAPEIKPQVKKRIIGPILPGREIVEDEPKVEETKPEPQEEEFVGPIIGPRPPSNNNSKHEEDDEEQAIARPEATDYSSEWKKIREEEEKQKIEAKKPHREEWMTSLPEGRTGLSALTTTRRFSKSGNVAKRDSSWTASPSQLQDSSKKQRLETAEVLKEDSQSLHAEQQARMFDELNKLRGPSLLQQHQEAMKGKPKSQERRPFDREKDVTTRYIDPNKRQQMISDAKNFNSMFTRGGT